MISMLCFYRLGQTNMWPLCVCVSDDAAAQQHMLSPEMMNMLMTDWLSLGAHVVTSHGVDLRRAPVLSRHSTSSSLQYESLSTHRHVEKRPRPSPAVTSRRSGSLMSIRADINLRGVPAHCIREPICCKNVVTGTFSLQTMSLQ